MKRAIVTGVTGVVGSAIARALLSHGVEVYGVCRPNSSRIKNAEEIKGMHVIECDASDYEKLSDKIAEPCDAFYYLTWLGTQSNDNRADMYCQVDNIKYALDSVNAAEKCGCKVFIGAGSQAEYGCKNEPLRPDTECNPVSGYGMAKLCAGQMTRSLCEQKGIRHIWTRIVSTYGPNDREKCLVPYVINMLKNGDKPLLTPCDQIWDYIYADDEGEAFYAIAEKGRAGAIYVLGSGEARPLSEYVEIIRNEINPNIEIGFGEREYNPDQMMYLQADISSLKTDTGWEPRFSFRDGIKKLLEL